MPFVRETGNGVRAGLWQRRCGAKGQHHGAHGFEPGEPSQPAGLNPESEGVGSLEKAAERLERRHSLQVDRNLFAVAVRRLAVNDLDVETRQARGRPGCADLALLWVSLELRQSSPPLFFTIAYTLSSRRCARFIHHGRGDFLRRLALKSFRRFGLYSHIWGHRARSDNKITICSISKIAR